jgi:hypothetical protein
MAAAKRSMPKGIRQRGPSTLRNGTLFSCKHVKGSRESRNNTTQVITRFVEFIMPMGCTSYTPGKTKAGRLWSTLRMK